MEKTLRDLVRGDRFTTRSGQFGQHTQDYFVVNGGKVGNSLLITAVSANSSSNVVAAEYELKLGTWNHAYEVWQDAVGRWYVTWSSKKDGPDLLESVELPTPCLLCGGIRSVARFKADPLCIDCRHKLLGGAICDCAPYGQHMPIFCDRCGCAYSTKNIGSIGSRSIFAIHDEHCECKSGWYFHDCEGRLFVKGAVVGGTFVRWANKYEKEMI